MPDIPGTRIVCLLDGEMFHVPDNWTDPVDIEAARTYRKILHEPLIGLWCLKPETRDTKENPMINEHAEICKQGAAVLEAELRKPRHDQITVCAIFSTPDAPGRIVIGIPAPEDAPEGFEVVTPGWGVTDWRAVPYEHLFTLLKNATGRMPILSY